MELTVTNRSQAYPKAKKADTDRREWKEAGSGSGHGRMAGYICEAKVSRKRSFRDIRFRSIRAELAERAQRTKLNGRVTKERDGWKIDSFVCGFEGM